MQPYLFPYLGYFHLAEVADIFVILDDVNFIKKGWINRNLFAVGGTERFLTVPLVKASQNRLIREHKIVDAHEWKANFLKTIDQSYSKLPKFNDTYPLVEDVIENNQNDLVDFLEYSLVSSSKFLGIDCAFKRSSDLDISPCVKGEEKIIEICKHLGAKTYINLIGGRKLYDPESFRGVGVELLFTGSNMDEIFERTGLSRLSIIDTLMKLPKERVLEVIKEISLEP